MKGIVKQSKYRHVHGDPARKDKCYLNAKSIAQGDGDFIHANATWIGFMIQGGGGPLLVHPRKNIARLDHSPPVINVHQSKLTDFGFSPFNDSLVATGGEDALVKLTVIPDELKANVTSATVELRGHTKKISSLAFHPVADNVLATSAFDHTIKIWDIQKGAQALSFDQHGDQIQSFAWDGSGKHIATTCKDKLLRIYDPRVGVAQTAPGFEGAKGSKCTWITKYQWIANLGFASNGMRQCVLHDQRKLGTPVFSLDIDQSAGQLSAHYDEDTSILFVGGKGDGNIRYFEISEEAPQAYFLSEFRSSEPQKGFTFLPKRVCDASACEIAICLRLMKDYIEPVSFVVPRKSDVFQEDIFPDTYAGVPSLSADEWIAGKDADAKRVSMRPGAAVAQERATFKAAKSAVELEAELAAAHKRIAELEAEVARLKH